MESGLLLYVWVGCPRQTCQCFALFALLACLHSHFPEPEEREADGHGTSLLYSSIDSFIHSFSSGKLTYRHSPCSLLGKRRQLGLDRIGRHLLVPDIVYTVLLHRCFRPPLEPRRVLQQARKLLTQQTMSVEGENAQQE